MCPHFYVLPSLTTLPAMRWYSSFQLTRFLGFCNKNDAGIEKENGSIIFLFLVVILSESVESISLIPTHKQFSQESCSLALAAENDASTFTGQLINMINAWWETEKQFSITKSKGKIIVSSLPVIWLERKAARHSHSFASCIFCS